MNDESELKQEVTSIIERMIEKVVETVEFIEENELMTDTEFESADRFRDEQR